MVWNTWSECRCIIHFIFQPFFEILVTDFITGVLSTTFCLFNTAINLPLLLPSPTQANLPGCILYKPELLITWLFLTRHSLCKGEVTFYHLQYTCAYQVLQRSRVTVLKASKGLNSTTLLSYITQATVLHGVELCVSLAQTYLTDRCVVWIWGYQEVVLCSSS